MSNSGIPNEFSIWPPLLDLVRNPEASPRSSEVLIRQITDLRQLDRIVVESLLQGDYIGKAAFLVGMSTEETISIFRSFEDNVKRALASSGTSAIHSGSEDVTVASSSQSQTSRFPLTQLFPPEQIGTIHSFSDGKFTAWAVVHMPSGEFAFISAARTGLVIKKGKLGLFGRTLHRIDDIDEFAFICMNLQSHQTKDHTPPGIKHPPLKVITNTVMQLGALSDIPVILGSWGDDFRAQNRSFPK